MQTLSLLVVALLVSAPTLFAQDEISDVAEKRTLLDTYMDGGWMMHVLTVCSVGTIAVAVWCFMQVTAKKMVPPLLVEQMTKLMQKREAGQAYELCQAADNSFTRVLGAALVKVNFERDKSNKGSMDEAAGEALDQEETRHLIWVNYLNVFATLAPMIGLLGTVMGMMDAFDQLEQNNSAPDQLAGGIRKAMGTTAGGLLVGIPAMFFYFFFRNKLAAIVSEIQRRASFMIDVLSGEVHLEGSGAHSSETEKAASGD